MSADPAEVQRLVRVLQEFDPCDDYHARDFYAGDYYAAIDRAIALIRGEISEWTDVPKSRDGEPTA